MTLIRRTNPLGELISLRQAMDRLFEDAFVRPGSNQASGEYQLALDVRTTADALVVEAALPGVKPEDVDISILGDTREDDGYSYREIRRGSFTRTLTLPGSLKTDAATASFDHGMLTLRIPKAEEAKPRQIRITPGTTSEAAQAQGDGQGNGA
jgi:HSP20 family protein